MLWLGSEQNTHSRFKKWFSLHRITGSCHLHEQLSVWRCKKLDGVLSPIATSYLLQIDLEPVHSSASQGVRSGWGLVTYSNITPVADRSGNQWSFHLQHENRGLGSTRGKRSGLFTRMNHMESLQQSPKECSRKLRDISSAESGVNHPESLQAPSLTWIYLPGPCRGNGQWSSGQAGRKDSIQGTLRIDVEDVERAALGSLPNMQ